MKRLHAFICTIALATATSVFAAQLGTTYSDVVPTTETVMFTGVSLADVRSVSAWVTGGSMGTAAQSATATAYHYSNDGSTLTVQFHVNLGNYTKCVKLRLVQDGDDIKGMIANAAYFDDEYTFYEGDGTHALLRYGRQRPHVKSTKGNPLGRHTCKA